MDLGGAIQNEHKGKAGLNYVIDNDRHFFDAKKWVNIQ